MVGLLSSIFWSSSLQNSLRYCLFASCPRMTFRGWSCRVIEDHRTSHDSRSSFRCSLDGFGFAGNPVVGSEPPACDSGGLPWAGPLCQISDLQRFSAGSDTSAAPSVTDSSLTMSLPTPLLSIAPIR